MPRRPDKALYTGFWCGTRVMSLRDHEVQVHHLDAIDVDVVGRRGGTLALVMALVGPVDIKICRHGSLGLSLAPLALAERVHVIVAIHEVGELALAICRSVHRGGDDQDNRERSDWRRS